MLNENRIKLMTKMAAYESTQGAEDLRISSYFRKDYVSLNTLITILWITVGYALLAGLFFLVNMDSLLERLTLERMIMLAAAVVAVYLILVIVYGIGANLFYKGKYNRAKQRVKQYYRSLSRLGKLYMKEK